jgi:transcriptional regulator with XRE-family HTH domain
MANIDSARATLSERVAEEIRALLARRRISGRSLASALNVSPSWVSYRLTGAQPIDLNDLDRIAEYLGVDVADLLPARQPRHAGAAPKGHETAA